MRRQGVRKILKDYARKTKTVQSGHREENLLRLMELERGQQGFMKFPAFVRGQIGMIGKYSLLWYGLWLMLFVLGLRGDGMQFLGGHRNEILLSVMPPFLLLFTAQDISRVFSDSMVELEKTTKFTPEHVVMVHFFSMSVTHALLLLVGIVLSGSARSSGFAELLLYGYTPLTLTTAIFLEMTRHLRGENLRLAALAVVSGIILLPILTGMCMHTPFPMVDIYSPDMLRMWKAALTVGTGLCLLEIMGLLRKEWLIYGIGNKGHV